MSFVLRVDAMSDGEERPLKIWMASKLDAESVRYLDYWFTIAAANWFA